MKIGFRTSRSAFTLIELLVVIAIIAILSVVVILTLNPAELLRQSRDANRLSDMSTLNSSINLYATDQSAAAGFSMGTPSTTYISIPDPTATSTLGDQCQGLGLPALATGFTYHCASSSTFRLTNGTGWVPINFQAISSGSPIGTLPVDATNQSSSDLYYTYFTDGTKYAVTAALESQKYLKQYLLTSNPDPARYALGSNLNLIMPEEGLIGYWPLNEGSGNVATDFSGTGNTGGWSGNYTSGSYYTTGKVGLYAGIFDGSTNYINIPTTPTLGNANVTLVAWIKSSYGSREGIFSYGSNTATDDSVSFFVNFSKQLELDLTGIVGPHSTVIVADGTWHFVAATMTSGTVQMYVDGVPSGSSQAMSPAIASGATTIGYEKGGTFFNGSIDDVRVYNRALSAADIQAIYNAEK